MASAIPERGKEGWIPILPTNHPLATPAWDAIYQVAESLGDRDHSAAGSYSADDEALFWAWLDIAGDGRAIEAVAAAEQEPPLPQHMGLHGGVCGSAWIEAHLLGLAGSPDPESVDSLANAIHLRLAREPWAGPCGVARGLAGIGLYFLEALPSDIARAGIELVLQNLQRLARRTPAGLIWPAPGSAGHYSDVNLPGGLAGIIYFLNELSISGAAGAKADSLLEGAVSELLAQLPETPDYRLAWCQGKLGIVSVLSQVARRTGVDAWRRAARVMLDHCIAWPFSRSGILDACLCHGSAGSAHIFNRLYQAEGDERCREASLAWLEKTLLFHQPPAGFRTMICRNRFEPPVAESRTTLIDGNIGIALALLAAVSSAEPAWDRLLMLSSSAT